MATAIIVAAGSTRAAPTGHGSVVYGAGSTRGHLWLLDVADGARRQLTGGGYSQESGSWDPSGRRLVFMNLASDSANETIAVLDTSTKRTRVIARGGILEEDPAWSPDGRRIAWSRTRTPVGAQTTWPQIWVMSSSGRNPHVLTRTASANGAPAWSPDGSRIAFVRWRSANSSARDIWVMRADGGGQRRLIANGSRPAYSPDGKWLAYGRLTGKTAGCCDVTDLYVARSSGKSPRLLVRGGGHPSWSPDGRRIAFQRFEGKAIHLWIVNADGSGLRRLTGGHGREYAPAWRPGS